MELGYDQLALAVLIVCVPIAIINIFYRRTEAWTAFKKAWVLIPAFLLGAGIMLALVYYFPEWWL